MQQYHSSRPAVILHASLLVAVGLAVLVAGGDVLPSFLSNRVMWRTFAGAAGLLAVGAALLVRELARWQASWRRRRHGGKANPRDAGHHAVGLGVGHIVGDPGPVWALLLPFVLLPAALGSSSAAIARNRAYAPPTAAAGDVPELTYRLFPQPGSDGVIEIDVASFATLPYLTLEDPVFTDGMRVRLVGFVHRKPDWPEEMFLLSRLAVWCCAADARLTGMFVRTTGPLPARGQWLRLEGTVGTTRHVELGDRLLDPAPVLRDVTYEVTTPPQEQFVPAAEW